MQAGAIGQVIQTIGLGPHRLRKESRPPWFYRARQVWRHPVRHRLASGGAVPVLHRRHRSRGRLQPGRQLRQPGHARARGFRRHAAAQPGTPRATSGSTGSRPTASAPGATAASRSWARTATSSCSKYIDIAGRPGGDHLFLVDGKGPATSTATARSLPYGRALRDDVLDRTETAMTQAHCFLAMELALQAQAQAARIAGKAAMTTRLRVAVVGAGIGAQHIEAYRKLPELYETARSSATSTPRGRTRSARRHGIPVALGSLRGGAGARRTSISSTSAPPRAFISSRRGRPCAPASMSSARSRSRARSPRSTR